MLYKNLHLPSLYLPSLSPDVPVFCAGDARVEYMTLSKGRFEATVRDLLLVRHYRVEVYSCKDTKKQDWRITYKVGSGGQEIRLASV